MCERNREQRGMAFRVGFWRRRTKILRIGFDIAVENRNRFFLADFFYNNYDDLKIMMTWKIVRVSKVSVFYIYIYIYR